MGKRWFESNRNQFRPKEVMAAMPEVVINYKPTPKQAMFHASNANEILYGGAAGGGQDEGPHHGRTVSLP